MRELDETDLEILELLTANARRPYKEIADEVGLTPPAVSDRIARLEDQGIIRGFTVDLDREKLRGDRSALVELEARPDAVDEVYDDATRLSGIETVYEGLDGRVVAHATLPEATATARSWLASELDLESLAGYEVTLVARSNRSAGLSVEEFALECVVCGKRVTGDGITRTVDGEVKTFCCPSCEDRYVREYESHRDALE